MQRVSELKKDSLVVTGALTGVVLIVCLLQGRFDYNVFLYGMNLLIAVLGVGTIMVIQNTSQWCLNDTFKYLAEASSYLALTAVIYVAFQMSYGKGLEDKLMLFKFGTELFEAICIVITCYNIKRNKNSADTQYIYTLLFLGAIGISFVFHQLIHTEKNTIALNVIQEIGVLFLMSGGLFGGRALKEKCDDRIIFRLYLFLCFKMSYHVCAVFFNFYPLSIASWLLVLLKFISMYYFAAGIFFQCVLLPQEAAAQKLKEMDEKILNNQKDRNDIINLSHELKTPIHVIQSAADVMRLDLVPEYDEKLITGLNEIKKYCYQSTKLITNVIDSSKLDEGYMHPKFRRCSILTVVEKITEAFTEYNPDWQFTINTNCSEHYILMDKELIEKSLINCMAMLMNWRQESSRLNITLTFAEGKLIAEMTGQNVQLLSELFEDHNCRIEYIGEWTSLEYTKKILKLHGGTLEPIDENEKGIKIIMQCNSCMLTYEKQQESRHEEEMSRLLGIIKIQCADI